MPPKKQAAVSADAPAPSSSDAPVEEKKPDAAALRKLATHPSTAIMVREALKELDSRKGVSKPAIQNYIKEKYPSVDLVRLQSLVRKALRKGLETGTLVRPAKSNDVTTGATGKFRLAPKAKEVKPKTENKDPNVQKEPKEAKEGAKKPKKAATKKKKDTATEQADSEPEIEDSKPPKKSKKVDEAAPPKVAPAKKPKAKKAADNGDDEEGAAQTKTKTTKATKEEKAGKAARGKAAKESSEAPATKATGKRGKKNTD